MVAERQRTSEYDTLQDFIDSYIELKMTEVMRFEMAPHPVEFDMYYSY